MVAPMPQRALELVQEFEGYHKLMPNGDALAYRDPVNVLTIGWGTTYYEDGSKVKAGQRITRGRAEQLLQKQLLIYLNSVDKTVSVPMHSWMRGACGSLAYNVGTGAFKRSTLARMINQKRWDEVPRSFAMWRYAGGRVFEGLARRRRAETVLFMAGLKQLQSGAVAPPMPVRKPSGSQPSLLERFLEWIGFGGSDPARA